MNAMHRNNVHIHGRARAGFDAHLVKPVTIDDLQPVLATRDTNVRRQRLADSARQSP